jgi:hypothetical protein
VLAFTLAVSALAAVLFGLAPLRAAANTPVALVLRASSTQTTASRGRVTIGKVLIAMQIAFCVMLLFASSLLLRTLRNYRNVDLGMKADSVLAFGVQPVGARNYAQMLAFYSQLTEKLKTLPGVKSVTLAGERPGTGWSDNNNLTIDGRNYPWDNGKNMLRSNSVGPDFFTTLGIPILAGRDIGEVDTQTSQYVAVINQTLADRYFKGASPIGHTLGDGKHPRTIVGVVRDSRYASTDEERMPMAWYSYQQADAITGMDVEVRTGWKPLSLLPAVRRVVHEIDPNAPLIKPQTLLDGFEETYLMPALFARLAIFLAALRRCWWPWDCTGRWPTASAAGRPRSACAWRWARRVRRCCGWCCATACTLLRQG